MCSFALSCFCHLKVTLKILPSARKREGFFGVALLKAARASGSHLPPDRDEHPAGLQVYGSCCMGTPPSCLGHSQPCVALESGLGGTGRWLETTKTCSSSVNFSLSFSPPPHSPDYPLDLNHNDTFLQATTFLPEDFTYFPNHTCPERLPSMSE